MYWYLKTLFFNYFFPFFADAGTIGWVIGLLSCIFISSIITWKIASWKFSKKINYSNFISAAQVRELYRQLGRTPTEKQVKQMLAAINNKTD